MTAQTPYGRSTDWFSSAGESWERVVRNPSCSSICRDVVTEELDRFGHVAQCFEPVLSDLERDDGGEVELLLLHDICRPCA